MSLLPLIPLILAQYMASDIETNCWKGMDAQEILTCTHTQRIHLGLYSMEQVPHLIRLQTIYRESENWSDAGDVNHHLTFLVQRNGSGAAEVLPILTWIPESECFRKEGWRYVVWVRDCRALRMMVVDSHILSYQIADDDVKKALALRLSYLVSGLMGKPLHKVNDDYTTTLNVEIPGKYRSDVWLRRAR